MRPHHSAEKLSPIPYLRDWENGAGGWDKERKPAIMPWSQVSESQQDEERRKKRKAPMSLTLLCTPYYTLADRRDLYPCRHRATRRRKPRSAASYPPSRHPNEGGGGSWAATLATSQAGTTGVRSSGREGCIHCYINCFPKIQLLVHHG